MNRFDQSPKKLYFKNGKIVSILLLLSCLFFPTFLFSCHSSDNVLNVFNWGDYIAPGLLEKFEAKYHVKVHYETFNSPEQMYAKYLRHRHYYDVLGPSDYIVKLMLKNHMVQALPWSQIPNIAYVTPSDRQYSWDPKQQYFVPYFVSQLGILYNKDRVKPTPKKWNILWDKKYAKRILMIGDAREAISAAFLALNMPPNVCDWQSMKKVEQYLIQQKPLVMVYGVDNLKWIMAKNEADLCLAWSGDAIPALSVNSRLGFVYPQKESIYDTDGFVVPSDAPHKKLAYLYINFLLAPENALVNSLGVGYVVPEKIIQKQVAKKNPILASFFPTEQEKKHWIRYDPEIKCFSIYQNLWLSVLAH